MKQRNPAKKSKRDYNLVRDYLNEEKGMRLRENIGFLILAILLLLLGIYCLVF